MQLALYNAPNNMHVAINYLIINDLLSLVRMIYCNYCIFIITIVIFER